ncbi:phospholipid scramblase 2 [Tetranychus urticae]|uniref:Phospholipid scramblase n=1 Tax=Tetranychus urticae TaxID=32264 RepID=T1L0U6_TETUR|nr:phospholipid scramblase 2 [Tetranychus urticae]
MSNPVPMPDDSLHSYDGAKLPSLQPKVQHSNTKPIKTEDGWMPMPKAYNCTPGLEYLTRIDTFLVSKKHDRDESKYTYLIKNNLDQKVYTAVEEYDECCMCCCSTTRPFDIRVFDSQKRDVINFYRPLGCQSCWLFCCLQILEVTASGTLCGFIEQSWSPFYTEFRICDATGKTVLLIKGPPEPYVLNQFKVLSTDGKTEVGNVQSLLPNLVQGRLADADHFSISFSMDLDVNIKAVLLAALILIDCLYNRSEYSGSTYDLTTALLAADAIVHCLHMCFR